MFERVSSVPTIPDWIITQAGRRAWVSSKTWRAMAGNVTDEQKRRELLRSAQRLYGG
jgi:hypothetical protein